MDKDESVNKKNPAMTLADFLIEQYESRSDRRRFVRDEDQSQEEKVLNDDAE